MTVRLTLPANGPTWLPAFARSIEAALRRPITAASYTVATVPDAATSTGQIILVTDETGGATLAFSDGTNFRRMQDRAIIS